MRNFCDCKRCKKMKRKGLVLGTRRMGFWLKNWLTGEPEYYIGPVSDYVKHPKFERGRMMRYSKRPRVYLEDFTE